MRRRLWWVGGAVVVVVASVAVFALTRPDGRATAGTGTAKVQRGTVTSTVSAAGTVAALQSRSLGFATSGTLTEVNVRVGDTVQAGAVLAKIDPASAQSAVDSAQESVDSAEDDVDNAETEAAAATKAATPSASASRAGGAGGTTGGTSTTQRTQGTDALMSAQQRLNNAKLALRQAQAKLAGTVITAPVAGRVLSISGAVGSQAQSGVVTLAGTADVAVKAQFTEAEVAALAAGQTATITLPDRDDAELAGKVTQIDPAGTVSNRLVRYAAVITFDQAPDALLYGQSANVVVTTESADGVLYVPSIAVVDGTVTVKVNGRTEKRTVEVGLRGDVSTEIRSGLNEGDEVLVSGG
ncbi:efflux RND transporter periplasmic adaptor subunit [Virgisporangium aurantiacum]|uniref:efflux RND transporter periplasmic adaptor subunit n=1 Tax=Virgisporangium aurantiacum TaxID=175570 RepID=UPI0019510E8E|nr:efflux RND transporter periplasmic adaptor subunit [Virgisporangium aurantiacum]